MIPREALDRIRLYDARLHAFVTVADPPVCFTEAPVGTFAVKDLIDVAGVPTYGGGRNALDPAPARSAAAVERLLQAGWAMVGKTHTVELAYGGWGTNRAVGAPWNPWNPQVHHVPGGSSSGSAVAIAAGLCDLALGTDTGGSLRIPAAICGVVGLKPGRGMVSLAGVHPMAPSLDTLGTLARTVATAAQGLQVIGEGRPFDAAAAMETDVRGRRLVAAPLDELGPVQPDVARLYRQAIARLRGLGVEVVEARAPQALERFFSVNGLISGAEGWRAWGAHVERHATDMDPAVVARYRAGAATSDARLAQALSDRTEDQQEFHTWLSGYDGMILPTCPITGPPLSVVDENTYPLSRLTRGFNYLDLPAASVPMGVDEDGMPAGLQIVGRPHDESSMVAFAAAYERVSGWDGRTPDLSGFSS